MTSPAPTTGNLADMSGLTPLVDTNAHNDPQTVYSQLRAKWGEVAPVELEPGLNAWLVMGYDELVYVARHERLFAMDPHHWREFNQGLLKPDSPLVPFMYPRPNAWFTDGEEHRRLRAPFDTAVARLPLRQTRNQVNEVCESLIGGFASRGNADLLREYAMMVPTLSVARMVGLDLEFSYDLHQAMTDMFSSGEKAQEGDRRITEILTDLVQARRARPAEDMTSVLIEHPNLNDDFERLQAMVLLIAGSSDTTMGWIGSSLLLMLTDKRFAGRMRGGRLDVDDALDEVLWREPPMANLPARFALSDTELAGQRIHKGDALVLAFAAAHADTRVRGDDQRSEPGNRSHLAWSVGPHVCPAQVPGRIIVRTAVEMVLHRLPNLSLSVPLEEIGRLPSPWTRCPASLPVTFTASSAS